MFLILIQVKNGTIVIYILLYLIASHPSKQQYLKTVKISLKPDLLSILKFALLLKGSRIPFKDLDFDNISSDLYPLDNLYSI